MPSRRRRRSGGCRTGTGLARTAVERAGDSLGRDDGSLREFLDGGGPDDVGRAFAADVDARYRGRVATPATDRVVAAEAERS